MSLPLARPVAVGAVILAAFAVHRLAPELSGTAVTVGTATEIARITGAVRGAGGRPLPQASISVPTHGARTTSDSTGGYVLDVSGVQRGEELEVRVSAVGHRAEVRRVRVGRGAQREDFTLAPGGDLPVAHVDASADASAREAAAAAPTAAGAATQAAPLPSPPPPVATVAPMAEQMEARRMRSAVPLMAPAAPPLADAAPRLPRQPGNREGYDRIEDNPFLAVRVAPRSTFSVDVDRASYGNVRRFLTQGARPPADAVRIEELVNYFPYDLPAPRGDAPIAVTSEVAAAPWRPEHRLVRIALQARPLDVEALPPSNLVFLVDVSGSMQSPDKLPLVKQALRLLVDRLRSEDHVALVVYAGNAGLVLPPTPGSDKARIAEAIDRLEAGGSTAGGAGLELAYRVARQHFRRGGNNRVVLATDGDFNVGPSSDAEMERLVEARRSEGTYLTVLGFGTGNYQDAKMKKIAKIGNGNYAYVDDLAEARKVLVHEMGATLHAVADDVKLQVEFNPAEVRGHRLIGYEGRLLRDEDFADDAKDAGEVGAGHAVTALYEVVPVGARSTVPLRGVDPGRYEGERPVATTPAHAGELLHVQLRWKRPGEGTSRLLTHVVRAPEGTGRPTTDFRFAAGVAAFGMALRESPHRGTATLQMAHELASGALGRDEGGHRAEFVRLVERARALPRGIAGRED